MVPDDKMTEHPEPAAASQRQTAAATMDAETFEPMPDDAARLRSLAESLRWAAQTIHQAYHHEAEEDKTWQECPRGFCASIRYELRRAGQAYERPPVAPPPSSTEGAVEDRSQGERLRHARARSTKPGPGLD